MSAVTVAITDPPKTRFRELEHYIGSRLYRKGTDPEWYVDFQDREAADMVVVNLNAQDFKARIMGDPQP